MVAGRVRLAAGRLLHDDVLVVGAYLLLMALGGLLRARDRRRWGNVGQIVFFAGALLRARDAGGLGGAAPPRARFHQQALLPQQVRLPDRVAALHQHAVVRPTMKTCGRTAVRAIAQIFASPGGMLFLARRAPAAVSCPYAAWPMQLDSLSTAVEHCRRATTCRQFLARTQWIIDTAGVSARAGPVRQSRAAGLARATTRSCASCRRCCSWIG